MASHSASLWNKDLGNSEVAYSSAGNVDWCCENLYGGHYQSPIQSRQTANYRSC